MTCLFEEILKKHKIEQRLHTLNRLLTELVSLKKKNKKSTLTAYLIRLKKMNRQSGCAIPDMWMNFYSRVRHSLKFVFIKSIFYLARNLRTEFETIKIFN